MKAQKILLIGEFSNLHWSLAEGLRVLGHHVVVVSNGDVWKNYKRDIDIKFKSFSHKIEFLKSFFFTDTYKGFDVVQFIGCPFLFSGNRTPWNKYFFKFLKKHNKKLFLGAFGDDYYYGEAAKKKILKYSPHDKVGSGDIYLDAVPADLEKSKKFNKYIATQVDGIIAGIIEYYGGYEDAGFADKLTLIPFPIIINQSNETEIVTKSDSKINFFLGIQKRRSVCKGTDVFLSVLTELAAEFPDQISLTVAEDIPYDEYIKMYSNCDILVDQLYSYSPAMNALTSMLQGKIVISGGEPQMYQMLNEKELFPIINFDPFEDIKTQFLDVIKMNSSQIFQRKQESRAFVLKHHHYVKVAQQYIDFWATK